ncbi:MAG TPA: non-reducing end alpha-L-arabinofuranosidase family hydrolase [Armatimonadota bacterium]|nr:non-reducing end alpha-L-arabinofuranosidase family hydrolase [Armatimonadota bacterium]HQK92571.1 non-reducing end alpha-L-arabinofuranosidase family hydrolase [Armatimonadota bacterium]
MRRSVRAILGVALVGSVLVDPPCAPQIQETEAASSGPGVDNLLAGRFAWRAGPPLISCPESTTDTYIAIKDPSVVFYQGRWHLFCSVIREGAPYQTEYLSFPDWAHTAKAARHILPVHRDGRYGAPQVFYFEPQGKWYLICQAMHDTWDPQYAASCATTSDIGDPDSWSQLRPMGALPADGKPGLDFWVICDDRAAHLFFTTLDGRMWREETSLDQFPGGWSQPRLALQGDIFEAGHIYRLRGIGRYLALIEAQSGHGWRYYKAYLADRLDGAWEPLAATADAAFASMANTEHSGERWTDCISHGELLRAGYDQHLEVDPAGMRFLFQGALDRETEGRGYGQITWRLGLLEAR